MTMEVYTEVPDAVTRAAPKKLGDSLGGLPPGTRTSLPAGEHDAIGEESKDQEAERLPREVTAHNEPHIPAEPATPDAPTRSEHAPGEMKRHALIRLHERCGELGDPPYGDRAKTAELAGEIAAQIGYHAGTARRELAKYLSSHRAAVQEPKTNTNDGAAEVA